MKDRSDDYTSFGQPRAARKLQRVQGAHVSTFVSDVFCTPCFYGVALGKQIGKRSVATQDVNVGSESSISQLVIRNQLKPSSIQGQFWLLILVHLVSACFQKTHDTSFLHWKRCSEC